MENSDGRIAHSPVLFDLVLSTRPIPMDWLAGAWAVFQKDLRLELRTRYAVNALLLFVASSLLLVVFAVGQGNVTERVASALLFLAVLFLPACVVFTCRV